VQLKDNLKSLDAIEKLTPKVMKSIETIVANKPAAAERFGQ
jgi:hypothetical protein